MKRINIHLGQGDLDELDKILKLVKEHPRAKYNLRTLSRADLIRFALAQYFGFTYTYLHCYSSAFLGALGEIIKRRAPHET